MDLVNAAKHTAPSLQVASGDHFVGWQRPHAGDFWHRSGNANTPLIGVDWQRYHPLTRGQYASDSRNLVWDTTHAIAFLTHSKL